MKHTDLRKAVGILDKWDALDRQQLAIRRDTAADVFVRLQTEPWTQPHIIRLRRDDVLTQIHRDMHELAIELYYIGVSSDVQPSEPEPPVLLPVEETPDADDEIEIVVNEAATTPDAMEPAPADDALDEETLRKMMRDPRYWRERNPEFVARVTEGFRRLAEPARA